ncbi:hypothetical protein MO973_43325 [Paenibacillus sp. TRM 82003]|nr:hypothetical protein [Paenibacillus sp. TRM 82003]
MSAKLLDENRRIIEIVWEGIVKPEDVEETTRAIEAVVPKLGSRFDVLVDMRNLKAFPQDTKQALVEHQRLLKEWGMQRASVAVGGAIAKMQLNRVAKESDHQTEFQWETYEEAKDFLFGTTIPS